MRVLVSVTICLVDPEFSVSLMRTEKANLIDRIDGFAGEMGLKQQTFCLPIRLLQRTTPQMPPSLEHPGKQRNGLPYPTPC